MTKDKTIKKDDPSSKETKTVDNIKMEMESDVLTAEERKEIIQMVRDDAEYGKVVQVDYVAQKVLDLKHYHMEKPSAIEGLDKEDWMSDRNLGLARATADSYQAVLLATCWTPDSINFVATTTNDIDNRVNQEKFTKWGMGKNEANAHPEIDAFIHNRVVQGFSCLKVYKKTWEEWVDRRIPVKNKAGKTYKWEIKTEKVKREKGVIENIDDIDDILMPEYGKNIQELSFFAQVLHLDGETILRYLDRKVFKPADKEKYKDKLYGKVYSEWESEIGAEKLEAKGITRESIGDVDVRRQILNPIEWYGYYTKNGRTERYRFIVDLDNDEVLSSKPVRKINRSGKIPYSGGSLDKEPGMIRGTSLMQLIAPVVNAFNNVFNQKSDFQYATNCPSGFYVPEEGNTKANFKLVPNILYPVSGPDAKQSVYMPNRQMSMAWAESDIRILFEVLDRLTGAASYFNTSQLRNKTLGQDMLVDKQSETRFGLWVSRIMEDIQEAVGMWFETYQDYPPKNLAERILGEKGEQLFKNLSIDDLRGNGSPQMTPDTVAGSKMFRKQLQMQAFAMGQQMVWLNPQINPKGNWNLCSDTWKELLGLTDDEVVRYLGPCPKGKFDEAQLANEWTKFMKGEDFDPPEGVTALSVQHMEGHQKQKDEKYNDLAEEYRPNFDAHLFKTMVNAMKFMKGVETEAMVNRMAMAQIADNDYRGIQPPKPGAPTTPTVPPAGPGAVMQPAGPEEGGQ